MTRYNGLEFGRKIREFSSKEEAEKWKNNNSHLKGKIGKYKNKKIYTICKTR
jgi:hypothetical protein